MEMKDWGYKWYLWELEKNPEIRKVRKWTYYSYKHQLWWDKFKVIEKLLNEKWTKVNRIWKFKIPSKDFAWIIAEIDRWVQKSKIAERYNVNYRTILRIYKNR
jgi:hypothetical protein